MAGTKGHSGIYKRTPKMKTGKYKRTIEHNKKISKIFSGKNSNTYIDGRTLKKYHCKDCNKRISWQSVNYGQGRCHSCAGKKNIKKLWKDKNYKKEMMENLFKRRKIKPNKPEKQLIKLLDKILPNKYKYVGDGKIFIAGFIPDFIDIRNKKIIELYGDYWHKRPEVKERDIRRLIAYNIYNYKTLIIWEHELKNLSQVKEKILRRYNEKT